jgi:hypothetical protein
MKNESLKVKAVRFYKETKTGNRYKPGDTFWCDSLDEKRLLLLHKIVEEIEEEAKVEKNKVDTLKKNN